jgi:menaquinone-specific isochorismate synthase
MQRIDIPLEGRADRDGLRAYLLACREAADSDRHFKIASISLAVRHIDPLAVLDSIYEGTARHCYMEHPFREWAVAGAESVASAELDGPGRFREARAFADAITRHTIAIGDAALPFSGPLFFCGFTFLDHAARADPDGFAPGGVFVPQWQVARRGHRYIAVANARVEPGMDIEPLVARIWAAHDTFSGGAYQQPPDPPAYHILGEREVGPDGAFAANVVRALAAIRDGRYRKVVLSRALDLRFDHSCQPLRILNRLRQEFPRCTSFSLQNEAGASFIGATPERLVAVADGRFATEAIAGSAARDPAAAADAALARGLLSSDKDLREHRHVVDSIRRRLEGLGLRPAIAAAPSLLVLPNVQHLITPIEGELPDGRHLLDLAEALHPTPAVGGTPREAALPDIAAWEPFARGLFAGLTGWFDCRGDGEFAVAIRSALVRGHSARLYAGAGIVEGSDPQAELRETRIKMAALLDAIRGAAGR